MPRKGMRSVFFKPSSPSSSSSQPSSSPSFRNFTVSLIEDNIESARTLITKWDTGQSDSYARITPLFNANRREAKRYLRAVKDLQSAMHYLIAQDSSSHTIIQAQSLMQLAMKRLQHEFYHILSANRDHLDPETVSSRSSFSTSDHRSSASDFDFDEILSAVSEDEFRIAGDSITETEKASMLAMADLKLIAESMISSGYGRECINTYKSVRKSIVDEALFHLGVEQLSFSRIQKMDWEVLELKIKSWLNAIKVAVGTLFYGERVLCDQVFATSEKVAESCFAEITRDGAMLLFGFPEHVAKSKKTPEKMFRTLDMYEAIIDNWPQIESIFSFESTSAVRSQAVDSLVKLGKAISTMLADFETAIQKESSKRLVPGGGVHPLTSYVMNYITLLADYSHVLADIVADWPLTSQPSLPESYLPSPNHEDGRSSEITVRFAWLILVLLCKIDTKAGLYKDAALSYLFLANNLQYVVVKVRTSELSGFLGEEWLTKHESKVTEYVSKYERIGWSKVMSLLPENLTADMPPEKAKVWFRNFNNAFHEAYRKQTSWIVSDPKMREEVKASIEAKLVTRYAEFYEAYRVGLMGNNESDSAVRFSPDDLRNYLSDILHGLRMGTSGSSFSSQSSSSSRRSIRLWASKSNMTHAYNMCDRA
ncbi:exocyst complex component EXO70H1-like [Senna tora]|uniref:Exocyst subunit Exo70 family protein n=1 Tax=Senna tora TaxID=362788 RepID=A0A834W1B9_9FABA|nr:exocyst complex component EXO70H1-like [Senna tora]